MANECGKNFKCVGEEDISMNEEFEKSTDYKYTSNRQDLRLKEAEKTIENKDVIIKMLQDQVKKLEESYKNNLKQTENFRYKYCLASQKIKQILPSCSKCTKQKPKENKCIKKNVEDVKNCNPSCPLSESYPHDANKCITQFIESHYKSLQNLVEKILENKNRNSGPLQSSPTEKAQEQNAKIVALQEQIDRLEEENAELEHKLAEQGDIYNPVKARDSMLEALKRTNSELREKIETLTTILPEEIKESINAIIPEEEEDDSNEALKKRKVSFPVIESGPHSLNYVLSHTTKEQILKSISTVNSLTFSNESDKISSVGDEKSISNKSDKRSSVGEDKSISNKSDKRTSVGEDKGISNKSDKRSSICDQKCISKKSDSKSDKRSSVSDQKSMSYKSDKSSTACDQKCISNKYYSKSDKRSSIGDERSISNKSDKSSSVRKEKCSYLSNSSDECRECCRKDTQESSLGSASGRISYQNTKSSSRSNSSSGSGSLKIQNDAKKNVPTKAVVSFHEVQQERKEEENVDSTNTQEAELTSTLLTKQEVTSEVISHESNSHGILACKGDSLNKLSVNESRINNALNKIQDTIQILVEKQECACKELEAVKGQMNNCTETCSMEISKLKQAIEDQKKTFLNNFQENRVVTDNLIVVNDKVNEEISALKNKVEILYTEVDGLKQGKHNEQRLKDRELSSDDVITVAECRQEITSLTQTASCNKPKTSLIRSKSSSSISKKESENSEPNIEEFSDILRQEDVHKDQHIKCLNELITYYDKMNQEVLTVLDTKKKDDCKCGEEEITTCVDKIKHENIKLKETISAVVQNLQQKMRDYQIKESPQCSSCSKKNTEKVKQSETKTEPVSSHEVTDKNSEVQIEDIYNTVLETTKKLSSSQNSDTPKSVRSIRCSCKINLENQMDDKLNSIEDIYEAVRCSCLSKNVKEKASTQSLISNEECSKKDEAKTPSSCSSINCLFDVDGKLCDEKSLIKYLNYLHDQLNMISSIENRIDFLREDMNCSCD